VTEALHLAKPSSETHQDDLLGPTPSRGLMSRYSCLLALGPADHIDVTLSGEIDLTATDELARIARVLTAVRPTSIQVDLQAVTLFCAAGVNFVAILRTLATEQHAALTVRAAPPYVHRLLDLCGLGDVSNDRADSTSRPVRVTCEAQERQEIGSAATLREIDACAGPP
jgi:anti-anti-sigma factor